MFSLGLVLGVVLYLNFLPFGYSMSYTINVGMPGDDSGIVYLEGNLGSRQMIDGVC